MKNKEKYNLNKLEIKVAETQCTHTIEALYKNKIVYKRSYLVDNSFKKVTDFFRWLEQEYKPSILDDVEKAYLSAVIKPFRGDVEYIEKINHSCLNDKQYLRIELPGDYCTLPLFEKGTMYKGMEVNKRYTLEELGL